MEVIGEPLRAGVVTGSGRQAAVAVIRSMTGSGGMGLARAIHEVVGYFKRCASAADAAEELNCSQVGEHAFTNGRSAEDRFLAIDPTGHDQPIPSDPQSIRSIARPKLSNRPESEVFTGEPQRLQEPQHLHQLVLIVRWLDREAVGDNAISSSGRILDHLGYARTFQRENGRRNDNYLIGRSQIRLF